MDPAKQKPSKSLTTSVPSIAIRFHCGDEDVDILADDEGDEEAAHETSAPCNESRDPSPIKEYFKGLGKRSTSVDSSMDATPTPPAPDKWRIFSELRGKITKTVEEKLTEMKAERKATPVLSRLRAGADQSSISDSEDISETAPLVGAVKPAESQASTSSSMRRESSLSSKRRGWRSRSPRSSKETKLDKKRRKQKRGSDATGSSTSDDEFPEEEAGPEVEAGQEAEEEPRIKFAPDEEYEVDTTIDYRTEPPTAYFAEKRKSHVFLPPEEPLWRRVLRGCWRARWLAAAIAALAAYIACPLNAFANGVLAGVLLTIITHFTIGLSGFLEPEDVVQHRPFMVPDFASRMTLETPLEQSEMQLTTAKCAGWMNELPYEYDPETYHINNTQTVYVRLEGSTLRISHPRNKVQKRATWDERKYKMKFVHQRIYDLAGCQLLLLPEGLTRRRIWSKKYPLCLVFPRNGRVSNEDLTEKLDEDNLQESPSDLPLADKPIIPSMPDVAFRARSGFAPSHAHFAESHIGFASRARLAHSGIEFVKPPEDGDTKEETCLIDSNVPTPVGSGTEHHIKFQVDEPTVGADGDDDFCLLDEMPEPCLYLFARADRQKEDWYRRLTMAIRFSAASIPEERSPEPSPQASGVSVLTTTAERQASPIIAPNIEFDYEPGRLGSCELVTGRAGDIAAQRYLEFMARFPLQIPRPGSRGQPQRMEREVDCDVLWLNAMVGHILYDLLASPDIIEKVSQKIQKKLDLIKLPYFIENLVLSDVDLGRDVPMIHRASRPVLDDHGLWVDLDVTFEGCIRLTLETKLNLMKLKVKKPEEDAGQSPPSPASPPSEMVEGGDDQDSFGEDQGEELDPIASLSGVREPRSFTEARSSASKQSSGSTTQSRKSSAEQRPPLEKGPSSERHSSTEKKSSNASLDRRSLSQKSAQVPNLQSAIYNSDIEDSAESSETEPDTKSAPTSSGNESGGGKSESSPSRPPAPTGKGMMRMMNKVVASRFFQQATEYKYIKRAMEGVSRTVITLTVEVRALSGQLAVNLPPPPSDRLWYGFRGSPGVWLKARPKFGDRSVSMHRVVSFIEKKLVQEMEKKLVLPNMDDIVIPPMTTELP